MLQYDNPNAIIITAKTWARSGDLKAGGRGEGCLDRILSGQ